MNWPFVLARAAEYLEAHDPHTHTEVSLKHLAKLLGPKPRKNSGSHIDASHSRQPLVKGERLVRNEVNAVMLYGAPHMFLKKVF